jgi:hypothetical protein
LGSAPAYFFRNDDALGEKVRSFRFVPPKVSRRKKTSKVGGSGGRIGARAVYVAATAANLEGLLAVIAKTKSC